MGQTSHSNKPSDNLLVMLPLMPLSIVGVTYGTDYCAAKQCIALVLGRALGTVTRSDLSG